MMPSTHYSLLRDMVRASRQQHAWHSFHERYGDVIHAWCRRRGLQSASAEDLGQEVLVKLFQKLPSFDPARGRFRSWLKAVVSNALSDSFRKTIAQPEPHGVGGGDFVAGLDDLTSPDAVNDLSLAIEQRANSIAATVFQRVRARLNKPQNWDAFYQTMVEGAPAAEVAERLGVRVGTVYKVNLRIKQMIIQEYRNVTNGSRHPRAVSQPADTAPVPA